MKRNIIFAVSALLIGILSGLGVYGYHYFYPEKYVKNEQGEYENITVAASKETFPVSQSTTFEIQHYYPDENRTLTEQVDTIPILIGSDKEEVLKYLEDYMNHLSQEEQEKGLVSYELISYQDNHISLRKTYKKEEVKGYYAKSFNGTIVILNGDGKTVYEYTQIPINTLPEELQEKVISGYYLETDEALYSFLENYSS